MSQLIKYPADGALLVVFASSRYISTAELIQLRTVNHTWKVLIEQTCAEKRSIALFDSSAELNDYRKRIAQYPNFYSKFSSLTVLIIPQAKLNGFSVDSIVEMFPYIGELVFYYSEQFSRRVDILTKFFRDWSVVSLTLIGFSTELNVPSPNNLWIVLWRGHLHTLRKLHLFDIGNCFVHHFPVMRQLTALSVDGFCNSSDTIVSLLSQLTPKLTHLLLDNFEINSKHLRQMFCVNRRFTHNVTTLIVGKVEHRTGREVYRVNGRGEMVANQVDLLNLICQHFHRVEQLNIQRLVSCNFIKLGELFLNLKNLPVLVRLHLNLTGSDLVYASSRLHPCLYLTGVQELHLEFEHRLVSKNQVVTAIQRLFPNVTRVYLRFNGSLIILAKI